MNIYNVTWSCWLSLIGITYIILQLETSSYSIDSPFYSGSLLMDFDGARIIDGQRWLEVNYTSAKRCLGPYTCNEQLCNMASAGAVYAEFSASCSNSMGSGVKLASQILCILSFVGTLAVICIFFLHRNYRSLRTLYFVILAVQKILLTVAYICYQIYYSKYVYDIPSSMIVLNAFFGIFYFLGTCFDYHVSLSAKEEWEYDSL